MFGGSAPEGAGRFLPADPCRGMGRFAPRRESLFPAAHAGGVEGFRPSEGESLFPRRKSDQNAA